MPAGRKPKFTPERVAKILEGLRSGMTKRAASAYAGVHEDTLHGWLRQKSKSDFSAQVAEAENEAESRYTAVIAKAAFGYEVRTEKTVTKPDGTKITTIDTKREFHPQMALEWLKRRRRLEWGDKIDIDLNREIEETLRALREETPQDHVAEPTLH